MSCPRCLDNATHLTQRRRRRLHLIAIDCCLLLLLPIGDTQPKWTSAQKSIKLRFKCSQGQCQWLLTRKARTPKPPNASQIWPKRSLATCCCPLCPIWPDFICSILLLLLYCILCSAHWCGTEFEMKLQPQIARRPIDNFIFLNAVEFKRFAKL